jgi:2-methylcitrate dehydratase PrpD
MTLLEQAGEFAAGLKKDAIPARVRAKARLQTMSMLAAVLSGARTPAGRAVARAVAGWETRGRAWAQGVGRLSHPVAAVIANSSASMALDYDDYGFAGHTGHSAVLAALAAAQEENATVGGMTAAQVAANEIALRLGASVILGPHNGQMWSHIHLAGAAAAAGKVIGLDGKGIADAMAIALSQPNYALIPAFMGAESKALTAATPAATGYLAAELAAEGMKGRTNVLEAKGGFYSRLALRPLPKFFSGFGDRWATDTLAFKIYPGCAYVDAAVDALLELTGGRPVPECDIAIRATVLTWGMERACVPYRDASPMQPTAVNFSVRLSAAIAAMSGRLTPAELDPAFLLEHEPEIRARTARIRLHHDAAMTARMVKAVAPLAFSGRWEEITMPFSAEVRLGGKRVQVEIPRGAPGRSFDETERLVLSKLGRETEAAERITGLLDECDTSARAIAGSLARALPDQSDSVEHMQP